jgi:hypothetical protein
MHTQLPITAMLAAVASLVAAAPRYVPFHPNSLSSANHIRSILHDRSVAFDWGTDKVRGVNIGGWLVLEP